MSIPLRSGDPSDIRLAGWRENVGAPISRAFAPASRGAPETAARIAVLSWNVWIGRGRLTALVRTIREGGFAAHGVPPGPLVALVQEAFRADESVPADSNGWAPRERPREFRPQEDIAEAARELGLNLIYSPSMRNGIHRSDRGNAILSDLPLEEASAFELPFVVQRRVPLGATVRVPAGPSSIRLRIWCAHLDPWGTVGRDWLGAAGRAVQARALLGGIDRDPVAALPFVLGADLNTSRGRREAAYRLLAQAGFTLGVPHQEPSWRHTYHVLPRLPIDYLLFREAGAGGAVAMEGPSAGGIASATVLRLDEDPRDRGPFVFGSDHHPLLAAVRLAPAAGAPR